MLAMPDDSLPEPWQSFLADLAEGLDEPVTFECVGGFVLKMLYGSPLPTSDVDVVELVPRTEFKSLQERAGKDSPLHKKHGVYLDLMGAIMTLPESYKDRLQPLFQGQFDKIQIFALDPYDLALSKIERNSEKDRRDVLRLAKIAHLDTDQMRQRYNDELRPYLVEPIAQRSDTTLSLWTEMINEDREDNTK